MDICRCRSADSSPNRPSRRTTVNARSFSSTMPLILHGLPPLHWALAGVGIAARHARAALRRQSSARHLDRLRRHLQPGAAAAVLPARGRHLRARNGVCRCSSGSCSVASSPRCSAAAGSRRGRSACSTRRSAWGRPASWRGCSSADCSSASARGWPADARAVTAFSVSRISRCRAWSRRQLHGRRHRHDAGRSTGSCFRWQACDAVSISSSAPSSASSSVDRARPTTTSSRGCFSSPSFSSTASSAPPCSSPRRASG